MSKLSKIFDQLSALNRHLLMGASLLGLLWGAFHTVGRPAVKAYAGETVLEILEEKGITPKSFADIQKKVDEIGKEQDQVIKDIREVQADVGGLKTQTDRIVTQQEGIVESLKKSDKSQEKIGDSVTKIYELLARPSP